MGILDFIYFVFFWTFFSILIGKWAKKWNRNGYFWFIMSFILSPLIAAVFLLVSGNAMPKCPHCLGRVESGAAACKNCGRDLL